MPAQRWWPHNRCLRQHPMHDQRILVPSFSPGHSPSTASLSPKEITELNVRFVVVDMGLRGRR